MQLLAHGLREQMHSPQSHSLTSYNHILSHFCPSRLLSTWPLISVRGEAGKSGSLLSPLPVPSFLCQEAGLDFYLTLKSLLHRARVCNHSLTALAEQRERTPHPSPLCSRTSQARTRRSHTAPSCPSRGIQLIHQCE